MTLWIGLGLLAAVAAAVVGWLVLVPDTSLPADRRRPTDAAVDTTLSRMAGSLSDALNHRLKIHPLRLYSPEALELAGLRISQADFIILVLSGGAVLALLGLLVAGPALAVLLFLGAPVAAHLLLGVLRDRRRAAFDVQLGDTLQLLTGSLRAGHSILRAIDAAAEESASPTAEEMRRVVGETSLGKDLMTALEGTATRMHNEDFTWIAQAIQINREVGGNLAEVLDQVGETIRERAEIKGHIKALAAEGKFSAYILVAMPFGIVAMLRVISPGYVDILFTHPIGWALIGASAVLMTIGCLWLRKIIDLKF